MIQFGSRVIASNAFIAKALENNKTHEDQLLKSQDVNDGNDTVIFFELNNDGDPIARVYNPGQQGSYGIAMARKGSLEEYVGTLTEVAKRIISQNAKQASD